MPRKKKTTTPPAPQETASEQQIQSAVEASGASSDLGPEMVDISVYLKEIGNRLVTAESLPEPDRRNQDTDSIEHRQLIVFRLGMQLYGIEISHVVEVMHGPEITPVPGLPDWVCGVCNVHGEIVSVVDLARFLQTPVRPGWQPEYMLVTQAQDQRIALAVDSVDIIYTIPLNQVVSPPFKIDPVLVQYLQGAIERSEDFIRLLDCERLLLGPQMRQFE
jgi:chemotaxis signal transduction protein